MTSTHRRQASRHPNSLARKQDPLLLKPEGLFLCEAQRQARVGFVSTNYFVADQEKPEFHGAYEELCFFSFSLQLLQQSNNPSCGCEATLALVLDALRQTGAAFRRIAATKLRPLLKVHSQPQNSFKRFQKHLQIQFFNFRLKFFQTFLPKIPFALLTRILNSKKFITFLFFLPMPHAKNEKRQSFF